MVESRRAEGSWTAALVAAGVAKVSALLCGSRLVVLRALRDAVENGLGGDIPGPPKVQAVYYFRSLRKAKRAIKTDEKVVRAGMSEEL